MNSDLDFCQRLENCDFYFHYEGKKNCTPSAVIVLFYGFITTMMMSSTYTW